jgi:hypothetical protein
MKTKEVDVYVPSIVLTNFVRAEMFTSKARDMIDGEWVKARLIIELPEKKITVSESDIDKAFNSIRYLERHENALCPYTARWLTKKLFEEQNEN